jgi:2-amino-4-hydroxy-6-hydroxymethyldihydropteridine diphosphokinase
MVTPALLGLGSNLGDRKGQLDRAVDSLAAAPGVRVRAVSSYYETEPVGGPEGQGAYLNAAALVGTDRTPRELLAFLQQIETEQGRERTVRWGGRTLDLDLLVFGARFIRSPELTVPHPWMAVRRFVLVPAVEIAPDLTHAPSRLPLRGLLARLDRRPAYLALAGPTSPLKHEVFARLLAEIRPSIRVQTPGHAGSPFAEAVHRLDERHWPPNLVGGSWLVSDFCPTLDWGHRHGVPTPNSFEIRDALDRALMPTFAAVIDPGGSLRPEPWGPPHAVIWPEGQTVEGITREILAACRAATT